MRPKQGSEVRDRTPRIKAKVLDETSTLAEDDVRLYVDGEEVAAAFDPGTGSLSHTAAKLSRGKHTIEIKATDAAGNEATKTWSFRVVKRG